VSIHAKNLNVRITYPAKALKEKIPKDKNCHGTKSLRETKCPETPVAASALDKNGLKIKRMTRINIVLLVSKKLIIFSLSQ
jgi:hypothetical protein